MRRCIVLSFIVGATAFGQDVAIPPGSEYWKQTFDPPYTRPTEIPREMGLRKQLFDLLRPSIERESGQRGIKFQGELKAFKNWAFYSGSVFDAKDRAIRFKPVDNTETAALWLRTRDGWKLVDYAVGFGDPFYWQWAEQYGAPRNLLGLN